MAVQYSSTDPKHEVPLFWRLQEFLRRHQHMEDREAEKVALAFMKYYHRDAAIDHASDVMAAF